MPFSDLRRIFFPLWTKRSLEKYVSCSSNIHDLRHFEICIAQMYLTSLAHCNACLILEKHVRVFFEGDILLNAWLLPLSSSRAPSRSCPASRQCRPCSGLVPLSPKPPLAFTFLSPSPLPSCFSVALYWLYLRTNNHLWTQQ